MILQYTKRGTEDTENRSRNPVIIVNLPKIPYKFKPKVTVNIP